MILSVRHHRAPASVLQGGEVEEVGGAVNFVVEFFRVGELEIVFHVRVVTHTCIDAIVTSRKQVSRESDVSENMSTIAMKRATVCSDQYLSFEN